MAFTSLQVGSTNVVTAGKSDFQGGCGASSPELRAASLLKKTIPRDYVLLFDSMSDLIPCLAVGKCRSARSVSASLVRLRAEMVTSRGDDVAEDADSTTA